MVLNRLRGGPALVAPEAWQQRVAPATWKGDWVTRSIPRSDLRPGVDCRPGLLAADAALMIDDATASVIDA
jgi:hypothetical protein